MSKTPNPQKPNSRKKRIKFGSPEYEEFMSSWKEGETYEFTKDSNGNLIIQQQ